MKLNFSKFLKDRGNKATVPAAKFSGQRYGIGNSSFYDEDEEGDVKMVRPSRDSERDVGDEIEPEREFDNHDDEMNNFDDGFEDDDFDEDSFDEDSFDEDDSQMSAETARVLSDLIHSISSCDSEMCDNIKNWIDSSDHFSDSDREYLMQMFDDTSSEFDNDEFSMDDTDVDMDVDMDSDFDDRDTDDEMSNDLDDKLNSLKNRYKDEEEEMFRDRFSSKKKF